MKGCNWILSHRIFWRASHMDMYRTVGENSHPFKCLLMFLYVILSTRVHQMFLQGNLLWSLRSLSTDLSFIFTVHIFVNLFVHLYYVTFSCFIIIRYLHNDSWLDFKILQDMSIFLKCLFSYTQSLLGIHKCLIKFIIKYLYRLPWWLSAW